MTTSIESIRTILSRKSHQFEERYKRDFDKKDMTVTFKVYREEKKGMISNKVMDDADPLPLYEQRTQSTVATNGDWNCVNLGIPRVCIDVSSYYLPNKWSKFRFRSIRRLAKAVHGEIRLVHDVETKSNVVVKTVHGQRIRKRVVGELENPLVEFGAMSYLFNHAKVPVEFVARLHGLYNDTEYGYMVYEYCEKGDLFDEVVARRGLDERSAKAVIFQLLLSVHSLHANGLCHRDISLENVMRCSDGTIRLIDFGQADNIFNEDQSLKCLQGTAGKPAYRPPEMCSDSYYGPPVDIFAIGVVLFLMALGSMPWKEASMNDTRYRLMTSGRTGVEVMLMKLNACSLLSNELIDFLSNCLLANPSARPNTLELISHPWIANDLALWRWVHRTGLSPSLRDHARMIEMAKR